MNELNDILLTTRQFFWILFKTWVIGLSIVAAFFVFDGMMMPILTATDIAPFILALKGFGAVFFLAFGFGALFTSPLLVIVGFFVYLSRQKIARHPYAATLTIPLIATPVFALIMAIVDGQLAEFLTLETPLLSPFMGLCFIALSSSSAYYAFNLNSKMLGLIDE